MGFFYRGIFEPYLKGVNQLRLSGVCEQMHRCIYMYSSLQQKETSYSLGLLPVWRTSPNPMCDRTSEGTKPQSPVQSTTGQRHGGCMQTDVTQTHSSVSDHSAVFEPTNCLCEWKSTFLWTWHTCAVVTVYKGKKLQYCSPKVEVINRRLWSLFYFIFTGLNHQCSLSISVTKWKGEQNKDSTEI